MSWRQNFTSARIALIGKAFYKQNTMPELVIKGEPTLLPSFIGPYKIESILSKGGMGLVYLGIDPVSRKPLAIKILSPAYINHQEAVEHFLKEAKVIALTNHPNIVKLYGQGEWENGLYIALELISGISLKQFIMQHSLSLRRALEIILQVGHALLHLHSHGVIHRDLKPENILITEEGEIKVIDFGIAQLHEEKGPPSDWSRYAGTPHYMSPEQKEDAHSVTFATDIYSLGIILYELALGKLSYGIIHLNALPKGLQKIAEKALAVSVKERYQHISECIHDISLYLNSKELDKERPGGDAVKELNEALFQANLNLSPLVLPQWPQMDLGVAKGRGLTQLGLYYDIYRLPNNTFLLLAAAPMVDAAEGSISVGVLRGMVRMYLHDYLHSTKRPFKLLAFVGMLNQLLCEDPLQQHFAFQCLLLDPLQDMAEYIACGFGPLLHIPQGQERPRSLISHNDLLGVSPSTEFSETQDNWNAGDMLFFHTFAPGPDAAVEDHALIASIISDAATENLLLSAPRQAEAILKNVITSSIHSRLDFPKALITIQRII